MTTIVLADDHKIVRHAGVEGYQLFDIKADPSEQTDLSTTNPELREQMLRDLEFLLEKIMEKSGSGKAPVLSKEEIERLRSLGYVE